MITHSTPQHPTPSKNTGVLPSRLKFLVHIDGHDLWEDSVSSHYPLLIHGAPHNWCWASLRLGYTDPQYANLLSEELQAFIAAYLSFSQQPDHQP